MTGRATAATPPPTNASMPSADGNHLHAAGRGEIRHSQRLAGTALERKRREARVFGMQTHQPSAAREYRQATMRRSSANLAILLFNCWMRSALRVSGADFAAGWARPACACECRDASQAKDIYVGTADFVGHPSNVKESKANGHPS